MPSTRYRSLTAIAAGALVLATLSACGSSDSKTAASTTLPSSPTSASTSPSPSADLASTTAGSSGEGSVAPPGARLTKDNLVATMVAAMRAKKTAHVVMQIGSSVEADADVSYAGATPGMKMSMSMGPTKITAILLDGVLYLQQTAGGKYVRIDKSDPAMGNLVSMMSGFSPESGITAMKGAIKQVRYVGTDTIDGDSVSRYKVAVNTSAAAAQLGSLGSSLGSAHLPKTLKYDLYVDDQHLMRRMVMTVAGQHLTIEDSAWGKPVDIQAPPASQVQTR